jgi:hypothetical protein
LGIIEFANARATDLAVALSVVRQGKELSPAPPKAGQRRGNGVSVLQQDRVLAEWANEAKERSAFDTSSVA